MSEGQNDVHPGWLEPGDHMEGFGLFATDALRELAGTRIPDYNKQVLHQNPAYVEVAGSRNPILRDAIAQSIADGQRPRVLLYDPAYGDKMVRAETMWSFVDSITTQLHIDHPQTTIRPFPPPNEEEFLAHYLGQYMDMEMHTDAIPNVHVPDDVSSYHVAAGSVANYVLKEHMRTVFTDPRIQTISFVNSSTAGMDEFQERVPEANKHIGEEELGITLRTSQMIQEEGFTLVTSIISGGNITQKGEIPGTKSPAIGQLWVRPSTDEAKTWIAEHQGRYVVEGDLRDPVHPKAIVTQLSS